MNRQNFCEPIIISLVAIFSLFSDCGINAQTYLFVSLKGDNKVAVYSMSQATGDLNYIYSQEVSGQPASIALHPTKKYLYVARRSDFKVSAFSIDSLTGRLTFLNEISVVDNPVYISTDKTGHYLLTAYYNANKAAVYAIGGDGLLSQDIIKQVNTGTNPHAILTDPSNKFLYISNMTGNRIEQYSFDDQTGIYNSLSPAYFDPTTTDGPRHFVFNKTGDKCYFVNELGNSVTSFDLNTATGQLTEFQTISTLPQSFTDYSKCADIHITPNGKYLYATNRGHESVTAIGIDETTGLLNVIGFYPTAATPREADIDPSGKFLFVAGETGNNLVWYKIEEDGSLDSFKSISVGKTPSWITTVFYNNTTNKVELNKTDLRNFKISPNPVRDFLKVSIDSEKENGLEIELYDTEGRKVVSFSNLRIHPGSNEIQIDSLNYLHSGLYICKLTSNNMVQLSKVVRL